MSGTARTAGWLAASALLWMGVGAAATLLVQHETRADGRGGNASQLTAALEILDLSEEQRLRVQEIVAAYGDSVLALHEPVDQAEAEFWQQVLLAEQRADQAIAALLTADQRRRYEDLILGRSGNLDRSEADHHR